MPGRRQDPADSDALTGGALEALAAVGGVAIPGAGPLFQRATRKLREERERWTSTALARAEDITGLTREELADEIARDPRLVPLTARLLHAAGINGYDRTLEAMGAALADAVMDRDSIGECELILTALADLTENHTRVLLVLAQDHPEMTSPNQIGMWPLEDLIETSGLGDRVVTICSSALMARGLARLSPAVLDGGTNYEITDLGRLVLEVLDLYRSE